MKAILQIEELREALQKARPFVNPRAPFLTIRDIKLELGLVGDGRARLTATDLEAEFSTTLACITEETFDVVLPYRQSLCFLGKNKGAISLESSLPKGNTVKLEIEHIGRVEFNDTQLASDFPSSPKPFGDFTWTTQDKGFLRMLIFVATHASIEDSRPVLTGILLEEGGIAAADGFRLACYELPELTFGLGEKKVILPAKSAFRLAKTFSGLEEFEVAFNDQRSMAYFRGQDMQMVSQLIQGTFPNYKLLIPTSFDYQANLSVPVLLDRLSMLNGSPGITRFVFQPNHICEIIQRSEDYGTHYLVEMPARSSSEKDTFKIAFHKRYIEDAVRLFSLCDFQMTHPASPGVFKGDIEALTIIVMPMFVQWE